MSALSPHIESTDSVIKVTAQRYTHCNFSAIERTSFFFGPPSRLDQ